MKKNTTIRTKIKGLALIAGLLIVSLGITACVPMAHVKFNRVSERVKLSKGYLWFEYTGDAFSEADGRTVTCDGQFYYTLDLSLYSAEEKEDFASEYPLTHYEYVPENTDYYFDYCFIDDQVYTFLPCYPGYTDCLDNNTEAEEAIQTADYYILAHGTIYYYDDNRNPLPVKSADDSHLEEALECFYGMDVSVNYKETTLRFKCHEFIQFVKDLF